MFKKFFNYLKASKRELKKVSWPSRKETTKYTLVVIGISIGMAIFLGLADYLFSLILSKIFIK